MINSLQMAGMAGRRPSGATRSFSMGAVIAGHLLVGTLLILNRPAAPPVLVDAPLQVAMLEAPTPPQPEPAPAAIAPPAPQQITLPVLQVPTLRSITLPNVPAPVTNAVTAPAETGSAAPVAAPPARTPPRHAGGPPPNYMSRLMARLHEAKRYPAAARKLRQQGVVHIRFTIDRSGRVLAASLENKARFALLNEEAIALLSRAAPLPPLPDDMPERIELVVPIEFSLAS